MIIIAILFFAVLIFAVCWVIVAVIAPIIGLGIGYRRAKREAKANGMTLKQYRHHNIAARKAAEAAVQRPTE